MRALDADQAQALLAAANGERLEAAYDLLLDTGMRPAEAFGLHWAEVDLDAGTVFVKQALEEIAGRYRLKPPKTERGRRTIRLARRTVEALRRHRERMLAEGRDVEAGPVFTNTTGGWVCQSNFQRNSFRPTRERAGVPWLRLYDLRHTSATLLLGAGVSLRVVADRLGHENPTITLKFYAHSLPDHQEQAAQTLDKLLSSVAPPVALDLEPIVPRMSHGSRSRVRGMCEESADL
jgi:integrase